MAISTLYSGRRRPYTAIGIRRVKCTRCGAPARFQWNACANGNRWMPVCEGCDVALNRIALEFMRTPNVDELMRAYENDIGMKA